MTANIDQLESDDGGLVQLYHLYRSDLLRFLTARTGIPAEAEEVVQDLWFKVSTAAPGPIEHGRAYLFRMAQNLMLDRLREQRRRAARDQVWSEGHFDLAGGVEVADPAAAPDQEMEDREEAARLASAISALPPGAQQVFLLHKVEGLSHADVAARLGISRSGVEKHMAVAIKYLRRLLAD